MWTKYYKLPLHTDSMGSYVWTVDNEMALQFNKKVSIYLRHRVIDLINGLEQPKLRGITLHNGIEFNMNGAFSFEVRGSGNLTGIGGHNLSLEKAAAIQDDFAKFILSKISE